MHRELDATKTGFSPDLVASFKGDYKAFKEWYDPKYRGVTAEKVWKSIGGKMPNKKE
jgi:hypothetical protein